MSERGTRWMRERAAHFAETTHPDMTPRYSFLQRMKRFYESRGWPFIHPKAHGMRRLLDRAKGLDTLERNNPSQYRHVMQMRVDRAVALARATDAAMVGRARGADHGDTGIIADIQRRSRAYQAVTDALHDLKPHIICSSDPQLQNAFRQIEDAVGLGDVGGQFHSGGNEIAQARDAVMDTLSQLRPHIARARDSKLTATFDRILATVNRTSRPRAVVNGYHEFSRAATSRAADAGDADRNFRLQQRYDDASAGRTVHAIDTSDPGLPAGRVVESGVFDLAATERAVGHFFGGRR